jgi:hypothetical protein
MRQYGQIFTKSAFILPKKPPSAKANFELTSAKMLQHAPLQTSLKGHMTTQKTLTSHKITLPGMQHHPKNNPQEVG